MPQAISRISTNKLPNSPGRRPKPIKSGIVATMQKLHASIAAARNLVSPTVFAENGNSSSIQTIMIPVPDNGWAPAMWCGEFAMVDVVDREPHPDEFFVLRHQGGSLAIVRPYLFEEKFGRVDGMLDKPEYTNDGEGGWHWKGQYWFTRYGAQSGMRADGELLDAEDPLFRFHMSDGPFADIHLRKKIIGRVTGVLGHEGRSLNWRRWVQA